MSPEASRIWPGASGTTASIVITSYSIHYTKLYDDGIMSAIDFTMDVVKEKDPKGDRVKVIMSGKYP